MKKKGNKGLSTIVVTLILIVLSLVAVGAVWIVVSNLLKGQSEQVGLDKINFEAGITSLSLDNSSNNVSIAVERKVGEANFVGMKFYFYNETGTEVITEYFTLTELAQKRFSFHLNMNLSNLNKVSIVPLFGSEDGKEHLGNVEDTYDVKSGVHISTENNANCVPQTCSSLGYTCGNPQNGTCAGTLNCGTCNSTQTCQSGTCVNNLSNCSVSSYSYSCIGNISRRLDNCGNYQNQTCSSSQICVANATRCMNNLTSCVPTTCSALGYTCGTWANGTCAGTLNCGPCSSGSCVSGNCLNETFDESNRPSLEYNIQEDYFLVKPWNYEKSYNSERRYPLLIYLHGASQVKYLKNMYSLGVGYYIWSNESQNMTAENRKSEADYFRKTYPSFVYIPQESTFTWNITKVIKQIESLKANYRIDTNRIYLHGFSMGGSGSYNLANAYYNYNGQLFAGILRFTGATQINLNNAIMNRTSIWVMVGLNDSADSISIIRTAYNSLKSYFGSTAQETVEYNGLLTTHPANTWTLSKNGLIVARRTEFLDLDHYITEYPFQNKSVLEWLYNQSLTKR
jgi:predicted esterase